MKRKKRVIEVFASGLLALSLLTSCAPYDSDEIKVDANCCFDITEGDLTEEEVASILGADTSYISCGFRNGKYVRTLVTQDKPLYIVPTHEFLEWNDYTLEPLVDELNEIFKIINPQIKVVYSTTVPNGTHNVVKIDVVDELNNAFGIAWMSRYVKKGKDVYNFDCNIEILRNYWENNPFVSLKSIIAHEVGHVFGFDDIKETETITVMSSNGYMGINGYFSLNDLYLFTILYGDCSTKDEVLEIKVKLDEYYESGNNLKVPTFSSSSTNEGGPTGEIVNNWYNKLPPNHSNNWFSSISSSESEKWYNQDDLYEKEKWYN